MGQTRGRMGSWQGPLPFLPFHALVGPLPGCCHSALHLQGSWSRPRCFCERASSSGYFRDLVQDGCALRREPWGRVLGVAPFLKAGRRSVCSARGPPHGSVHPEAGSSRWGSHCTRHALLPLAPPAGGWPWSLQDLAEPSALTSPAADPLPRSPRPAHPRGLPRLGREGRLMWAPLD